MNQTVIHTTESCPLCGSAASRLFFEDRIRRYFRCPVCSLIFVTREFHVTAESEKARYEEHNNDADDAGYRKFLERIAVPLCEHFSKGAKGLDFGSGPTPLLATILAERGFDVSIFDPYYAPDRAALESDYDFVVATEVVEHLAAPLKELKMLFSLIRPDGMLALMTRPFDATVDFAGWHYKNDRTHICFFSLKTFDWIAAEIGVSYRQVDKDIFVFE